VRKIAQTPRQMAYVSAGGNDRAPHSAERQRYHRITRVLVDYFRVRIDPTKCRETRVRSIRLCEQYKRCPAYSAPWQSLLQRRTSTSASPMSLCRWREKPDQALFEPGYARRLDQERDLKVTGDSAKLRV
jgi:hypothetical protein